MWCRSPCQCLNELLDGHSQDLSCTVAVSLVRSSTEQHTILWPGHGCIEQGMCFTAGRMGILPDRTACFPVWSGGQDRLREPRRAPSAQRSRWEDILRRAAACRCAIPPPAGHAPGVPGARRADVPSRVLRMPAGWPGTHSSGICDWRRHPALADRLVCLRRCIS